MRKTPLPFITLLLLSPLLFGEDSNLDKEAILPDDAPFEATLGFGEEVETNSPSEAPSLDISHEKVSVESVILEVAEKLELNVHCPPALREKYVTIRLKNAYWRQIFDSVLTPFNYTYIEDRNIIKIRQWKDHGHYHFYWKIFPLNHRKASEIAPVIKKVIEKSELADFAIDEEQNALLIYEEAHGFNMIQKILEELDRAVVKIAK